MTKYAAIDALILMLALASCSGWPCPSGQVRLEERYSSGALKSTGCVGIGDNGNRPLQGKWVWFYESGQKLAEGTFKDGDAERGKDAAIGIPWDGRQGLFVSWYANGQKQSESQYKDGKREGLHLAWYANGQKQSEGRNKDDNAEGLWTWWHQNGQKATVATFKGGRFEGLRTTWHENGQKRSELQYKDGKPEGLDTFWQANGQKTRESLYKGGHLVESDYWRANGEYVGKRYPESPVCDIKDLKYMK